MYYSQGVSVEKDCVLWNISKSKCTEVQGVVELGWVPWNLPKSKCTEVQGVSVEVLEMGQVLVLELLSPVFNIPSPKIPLFHT